MGLRVLICELINRTENVLYGRWNYTFFLLLIQVSEHCVCLSTASLPIREYCRIESPYEMLYHLLTDTIINFLLWNRWLKNLVICEEVILTQNFFPLNDCNFFVDISIKATLIIYQLLWFEPDECLDVKLC